MSRPFSNIISDQIAPIVGMDQARLVSGVTEKLATMMSDELDFLEDHVTVPALAALLGYLIQAQTRVASERATMIADGAEIPPSLFQGEQTILAVVAATNGPDPRPNFHPVSDYLTRKRQMEYAMEGFQQGVEQDGGAVKY